MIVNHYAMAVLMKKWQYPTLPKGHFGIKYQIGLPACINGGEILVPGRLWGSVNPRRCPLL
jgi:hypothetical protein